MRLLCERYVPPRYLQALEAESWADVVPVQTRFHPEVSGRVIAEYAAANGWVVLTRDRDFFELASRFGFGLLSLDMSRTPPVRTLVSAIRAIAAAYADHVEIVESVPGEWI